VVSEVAAARTDQQCIKQSAVNAATHAKFLSDQLAVNLSTVGIASNSKALLIQDALKDEDLKDQMQATDKCTTPFVQTAEKIAKSPSNQEKDVQFSAADVLIRMKAQIQEDLIALAFPTEADPPWEEKTETKTARGQMISQTTKHNLNPLMPRWTKYWHCLPLLQLP
jgi:hypothetical protein